jgi:hypothetical protein
MDSAFDKPFEIGLNEESFLSAAFGLTQCNKRDSREYEIPKFLSQIG